MRVIDLKHHGLTIEDWAWQPSEVWCLFGGNGSGKSRLAAVLAGKLAVDEGVIEHSPTKAAWVSFESQQQAYEDVLARDDSDFIDGVDYGSTGLDLVMEVGCTKLQATHLASRLGIVELLAKHYRVMSSGEARQVLILQAWARDPDLLILDEPFEGLDSRARATLTAACAALVDEGARVMLVVNRLDDVMEWITHVAIMRGGRMVEHGSREKVLGKSEVRQLVHLVAAIPDLPERPPGQPSCDADPLIKFSGCVVRYGEVQQLEAFDWAIRRGQHTLVTGPNGAGKSTLLQLISGDHPQCYSNDISIFGYQRGSGETIWDIKKHIGLVSPALHRDYRAPGNALSVVLSGLYDSIGVYQTPEASERILAHKWLAVLGMAEMADRGFRELSHGQQRLVLIARALIKQPAMLILDEPTQGLDPLNRQLVLSFVDQLAVMRETTVLFVSHREDEHSSLFSRALRFVPSAHPGVRFRIVHETRNGSRTP